MSEQIIYRVVTLGDLYADSCRVCGNRAGYGVATKSGLAGCVEAVKAGKVYCKNHLPEDDGADEAPDHW